MKAFAATLLATAASASLMTKFDYDFMKYISKFNKMYETTEEFEIRKELFRATDNFIKEANAKAGSYRAAHNKFSDWTDEEFDGMLGLKNMTLPERELTGPTPIAVENSLPASFSW